MSNQLTTITSEDLEAFKKASGQTEDQPQNFIPRLKINKDGEDDAGKTIPVGTFAVTQNGVTVYGKPAVFRVLKNVYQYSVYDSDAKQFVNQTIQFASFSDEAIDEQGTVACGKINKKKLEGVSEAILKAQKNIKCSRIMYGVVSMDAADADGNKVELKELPVVLKLSGSNFMPIQQEALDIISKKKLLWAQVPIKLGTKRQKNGTNVWYTLTIEPDFENTREISLDDLENVKMFNNIVTEFNEGITTKYRVAKRVQSTAADSAEVINALDNDLNDDISDVE